mmetsp:Transcript_6777/g.21211  ORF Transcript_6777/g.21211 Transcript_6777/m.21211 type:complete len:365 (+) Transcript_6777:672-1766(+)
MLPLWHRLPLPQDDVQEKGRGHEGRADAAADHDHHDSTGRGAWRIAPGYDAIGTTHRHRRPARRWTRDPAPGAGAGASTGAATGGSVRHGQQARLRWRSGRRRGRRRAHDVADGHPRAALRGSGGAPRGRAAAAQYVSDAVHERLSRARHRGAPGALQQGSCGHAAAARNGDRPEAPGRRQSDAGPADGTGRGRRSDGDGHRPGARRGGQVSPAVLAEGRVLEALLRHARRAALRSPRQAALRAQQRARLGVGPPTARAAGAALREDRGLDPASGPADGRREQPGGGAAGGDHVRHPEGQRRRERGALGARPEAGPDRRGREHGHRPEHEAAGVARRSERDGGGEGLEAAGPRAGAPGQGAGAE